MILADTPAEEQAALEELRVAQKADFEEILEAMDGLPVTVRLLDPPLHEFLPSTEELAIKEATVGLTAEEADLFEAAKQWHEFNPMLGTRGVRLGVIKPGLYAMQVRALMEAAAERVKKGGTPVIEIMIPLTITRPELSLARSWCEQAIADTQKSAKKKLDVTIGTMIETPRACLRADEIASDADFFSFGTNDLTQMTLGFSRDDVEGRMMEAYLEQGLLKRNPFETIDAQGVGELVKLGATRGRKTKPNLKLGVCGEHGGDPESIQLFYEAGLDYVSCSPFRVPIARLAAAQAVLSQ
jgi:pyruvate,orthophosphate dikinase